VCLWLTMGIEKELHDARRIHFYVAEVQLERNNKEKPKHMRGRIRSP